MPTYDETIKSLTQMLEAHNRSLPDGAKKLDPEAVIRALVEDGFTDAEGLQSLTEDDFRHYGFPRRWARDAAKLVGGQVPSTPPAAPAPATPTSFVVQNEGDMLRKLGDSELIKQYNFRNPGLVGEILNERARGGAFLVFTDANMTSLDVEASAKRLGALQDGVPLGEFVMVAGKPVAPVRVGEKPEKLLDENPLYPGQPLGEDETCLVTNESWKGVSNDVRVLLALAVQDGSLRVAHSPEIARGVIEEAHAADALAKFTRRYQRTAARLGQMTTNELPSLKIRWGAERRLPFAGDSGLETPAAYAPPAPAAPVARFTGRLTGPDRKRLRDALLDAFRSRSDLARMLYENLDIRLDHITGQGSLDTAAFDLISDAEAKGYTGELVAAAKRANPGNPVLRAFTLPGTAPTVNRNELLDRLGRLLSSQFETLVFKLNVPSGILPGNTAPQATRAVALLQYAEQAGRLGDVAALLGPMPAAPVAAPSAHEIHSAVINSGLTGSRRALFSGINPHFAGSIPDAGNPSAQVLLDINHLQNARLTDGSNPYRTWLTNALTQAGPRVEAEVFRRALAALG